MVSEMSEFKPERPVIEKSENQETELSPLQMLNIEVGMTKQFLKSLWVVLIFWVILLYVLWTGIATKEILVVCVFGGVISLYLSNHLKVFNPERLNNLGESYVAQWGCFFDDETLESMNRLNRRFFRELSVAFLLEPGIQQLLIRWQDARELKQLAVLILEFRWVLITLLMVMVAFYLGMTYLMKYTQKVVLNELDGKDLATQKAIIHELKMEVQEMEEMDNEDEG